MSQQEKKGKIVVISGPSGVGKGTINSRLFEDPKLRLVYSVSMTTRKPRPGEVNGVNYFFASPEEFEQAVEKNELIEHANFIGNSYGTPRKPVIEQIHNGKNVVLEIEVEGATQVIKKEKNVLSIFLMPPSFYDLQSRIMSRGTEPDNIIKERLTKSLMEIPLKDNYQYVVVNDTVDNSVAKIKDILIKERLTDYHEISGYEKLIKDVREIIDKDYRLFVEILKENLDKLAPEYQKAFANGDIPASLTQVLGEKIYRYILEYGQFSDLTNYKKVQVLVNTAILNIDFFGVKNDESKKF